MTARRISASWIPATHALVSFDSDDSTSVVPLNKCSFVADEGPSCSGRSALKEGDRCLVEWTDKTKYAATIDAVGSRREMQDLQQAMEGSDVDEVSDSSQNVLVEEDNFEDESVAYSTPSQSKKAKTTTGMKSAAKVTGSGLASEATKTNQKLLEKLQEIREKATPGCSPTAEQQPLQHFESTPSRRTSLVPAVTRDEFRSLVRKVTRIEHYVKRMQSTLDILLDKFHSGTDSKVQQSDNCATDIPLSTNKDSVTEGCWLGDVSSRQEDGKKVWIPGGKPERVGTAESLSNCPSKMAINLMNALFTTEQMAEGNCTPTSSHTLLDQTIIQGIRLHIKHIFPCDQAEEPKRWKSILQTNMNAKCRHHRAAGKKAQSEERPAG